MPGERWMYLLAFDYPRGISGPPHVTLELLERRRLPVRCHLPEHIIHYFLNGLLLVCVHRLVHSVHRTRAVLFHVLFDLPWQAGAEDTIDVVIWQMQEGREVWGAMTWNRSGVLPVSSRDEHLACTRPPPNELISSPPDAPWCTEIKYPGDNREVIKIQLPRLLRKRNLTQKCKTKIFYSK